MARQFIPNIDSSGGRITPDLCQECNRRCTKEGYDNCIGELPIAIVMNACCGHGVESMAYVQFWDAPRISGGEATEWIKENSQLPSKEIGIMPEKVLNKTKTAKRTVIDAVLTAIVGGIVAALAQLDTALTNIASDNPGTFWPMALPAIAAGIRIARDWVKHCEHRWVNNLVARFAPFVLCWLLVMVLARCAAGRFKETQYNDAGQKIGGTKQWNIVFTPPGAKHAGEQQFVYKGVDANGDPWELKQGQVGNADGGNAHEVLGRALGMYLSRPVAAPVPSKPSITPIDIIGGLLGP